MVNHTNPVNYSGTGCQILRFCHNPTMMKTVTYLITYHYRGNEFVARIETDSLTMARRLAGAVLPSRAKVTKIETV